MSISGLLKVLCLFCAFAVAGKAYADNRLYVEDFTVSNYDVQEVPVLLDNTDEIAAFNFTLSLPDGIKLVGQKLTERAASSMQVVYNGETGIMGVISFQPNRCFSGNEGPVLVLSLQAEPGALLRNKTEYLRLSEITLSDGTGSQGWHPEAVSATVTMLAGEFAVTAQEAAYVVRPEVPATVALGLENSADVSGFQADIVVPEGFTVDENSFKMTSRCVEGINLLVYPQTDGVTYRVLMFNMAGGNVINLPVQGAESDVVFTFDVTAPATFTDAHADIQVKDVIVTALGNQQFNAGTAAIALENGKVPYDAAMAEVARLRQALADALATIAEEAADVKDNFTGEDITVQIDALEAALNKAYTDGTPATGYAALLEPVPAIDEAIAKLVADAKAAQEVENARKAANEAAYKADLETIAGLQEQLDAAKADIAENYPAFDATDGAKAIQDAIDAAKAAADAAYEAVAKEGTYSNTVDADSIKEAIAKLVTDAKAAQDAEDARKAANEEAYKADLETIAGLQKELDDAVAEIAENYPGYDAAEDQKAIQEAIDAAKAAADKAYADVAEAGTYTNTVDAAGIRDLIEKMMEAAEMTGIDTIMVEVEAGNAAIYNLQGVRLNAPARGQMNIVVDKAGKAFKIFVR